MSKASILVSGLLAGLFCSLGCGEGAKSPPDTVYHRLGEEAGVRKLAHRFLEKLHADSRINGYFLNSTLDHERLESCVVKQIGSATGGPQVYDCRGMKEAHAGLGISAEDFDDFMSDLTETLVAADIPEPDIDVIVSALSPMENDIVEGAEGTTTIYHKLGRKPGIAGVVHAFVTRVAADPRINAFFVSTNALRIEQCLVRQVCMATGGPCEYGSEIIDGEYESDETAIYSVCRDMKKTHAGYRISYADFGALVEDLVAELDAAGVPADIRDTILSVLGPLCPDIVEQGSCG